MSSSEHTHALAKIKSKELAESSTSLWALLGPRRSVDDLALHEQRIIAAKKVRKLVDEIGDLLNQIAGLEADSSDVSAPILKYHP